MSDDNRSILVIDSMNLFIRSFVTNESTTAQGELCGGVIGFIKSLKNLIYQFSPKKVYLVWEQGGGSPRRKNIFPEYKANRIKIKEDFADVNKDSKPLPSKNWILSNTENKLKQVKILVEVLKNLPVCQLYVPDCEGDDVVSYLIRHQLKNESGEKIIVSTDRDFYQLLEDPLVKIFNPATKNFVTGPIVSVKVGKNETRDIPARNYVLVRTLTGDSSDNIPGVSGLGFKTALKLFPQLINSTSDFTILGLLEAAQNQKQAILNEGINNLEEEGVKNKKTKIIKIPKVLEEVISSESLIKRNWELMYLDTNNLAAYQINKIEYAVLNFKPKINKINFIKTLLAYGIVIDINIDSMFYNMQISLTSS